MSFIKDGVTQGSLLAYLSAECSDSNLPNVVRCESSTRSWLMMGHLDTSMTILSVPVSWGPIKKRERARTHPRHLCPLSYREFFHLRVATLRLQRSRCPPPSGLEGRLQLPARAWRAHPLRAGHATSLDLPNPRSFLVLQLQRLPRSVP